VTEPPETCDGDCPPSCDDFDACIALDVAIMVCDMGLRAEGMTAEDLRQDFKYQKGGIVTFLNDANADGAMLFI